MTNSRWLIKIHIRFDSDTLVTKVRMEWYRLSLLEREMIGFSLERSF